MKRIKRIDKVSMRIDGLSIGQSSNTGRIERLELIIRGLLKHFKLDYNVEDIPEHKIAKITKSKEEKNATKS